MSPYNVVSAGDMYGFIEVVQGTKSLADIQKVWILLYDNNDHFSSSCDDDDQILIVDDKKIHTFINFMEK